LGRWTASTVRHGDCSFDVFDEATTALVLERTLAFVARV
jgi:hypothetical protein